MNQDRQLIARIAQGDLRAFEQVYSRYRNPCIRRMMHEFGVGSREDALDLFQEVCAALFNNVRSGRLTPDALDRASLRTYLNQIGKFILFNKRRKRQAPLVYDTEAVLAFDGEDAPYDRENDDRLFVIRSTVSAMPMPCSKLLDLVCFEGKSHKEVAQLMNYASPDTVKTQRSRCMQRLREVILKRYREVSR